MATYFHSPNNQREASPVIYTRESWPCSNPPEPSPLISTNMMMYMNYLSSANEMPPPHHEILPRIENEYSSWENNRCEIPFLPPMVSATSLLQGVQNSQTQQGLSLSLSTQIPPIEFHNNNNNNNNNNSNSNNNNSNDHSPNGMHPGFLVSSANHDATGGGRAAPNSKYLKAAQELLDEVVNVRKALQKQDLKRSGEGVERESRSENKFPSASEASGSPNELSAAEKQDLQNKLSKLMTMLDEVDRRYKQYYHQMQIVVSSFDVVAGPGAAKPYTALALQTISRHFRCLRDAIANQIRAVRKSLGESDGSENGKGNIGISRLRYVDRQLKQQRALQQLGMMQQHAWRPQRGLPESSVSILRAWLFEHFLHPYPKDSEKLMLARQTGLTRSQVSNWFINARVRLWKPMVEEMYKEETGEAETDSLSSPETGTKVEHKTPADTENQDLQNIAISTNANFQTETNQNVELRPCLDDSNIFQGYQIPGFGRFGNPNGVSLTLGLQHREAVSQNMSVGNQNFAIYNAESSSVGPETADYGSSHILRDFVA